jgi:hypothetical protein
MEIYVKASELKNLFEQERVVLLNEIKKLLLQQEKPNKNINAKQAADFLGISISTLYKRYKAIPHKRFGKKLLFSTMELEEFKLAI